MKKTLPFLNYSQLLTSLIAITLITAPLYPLRFKIFGYSPSTIIEVMVILTSLIWFIDKIKSRSFSIAHTKFDWIIIVFLLSGLISTIISNDWIASLGRFRAFFIEPIMFYYIFTDTYIRYWQQKQSSVKILSKIRNFNFPRIILISMFFAAIWVSILGILQYFFQIGIVTPDQSNRAHGFYNIGNQLAMVVGPMLLIFVASYKHKFYKYPYYLITLTLTVAFFATDSQGGWIGLFGGIIVIFVSRIVKEALLNKLMQYFIVGICLLFIIFLTQISHFTPKNINPWIRPGGTELVRLCLWEGAFNAVKDHPITGVGMAGFSQTYGSKYYTCDGEPFEDTDNILLNFWTKTGILGLLACIFMLLIVFSQSQVFIYQLPFIYWFIHGMVDVPYFKNDLSLYWWVFAALIAIHNYNNTQGSINTNNP